MSTTGSWLYRAACRARDYFGYRRYRLAVAGQNAQLQTWREDCTGDTIFILATGPSIRQQTLERLKGRTVLSCSNAFLHPAITEIAPRFHCFAPYHPPLVEDNWLGWLRQARDILPPGTVFVLGFSDRDRVERSGALTGRKVIYLYLSRSAGPRRDCCGPVMAPQSVPIMALPLALHLWPRRIILLGCDHTTLRNFGGTISHFYPAKADVRLHASNGMVWGGLESELHAHLSLFSQYKAYAKWLRAHRGPEVANGSPDSWLDVFPKTDVRSEFGL